MSIDLSEEEKANIYLSIVVRLGFIETGTSMRAQDAINCGKKALIKQLSSEQMKLVLNLEQLLNKML